MFNNLLESKKKTQRNVRGSVASILAHVGLIAGAVVATAGAAVKAEKLKEEKIDFMEVKKDEPPPPKDEPKPPPPDMPVAPPPPKGFQILTAPIDIPDVIPDIDLSKRVTDEADFSGKGAAGGTSKGVEGGKPQAVQTEAYYEFQVEKPVVPNGGAVPRYPDILRTSGVEGSVMAQFVVDTTGRVEPGSLKILKSDHDLFASAVKAAIPGMRFIPAEVGGKKVRQLVQQPFGFAITK